MTEITSNNRHFHRIFYNSDVILKGESKSIPCKLIDISLKGCLLRFDEPWTEPLERLYTLELQLSEDRFIYMQVSVSHVINCNAGFKCEHIDIDSISQLRRLVELNLGDSEMLERDLLALTELKV
ncbi:MAG: PilZ domain-containing protein [Methylococcales bacterium]|nr:PilZ domain-containing protein [Methylococcales bacterium]